MRLTHLLLLVAAFAAAGGDPAAAQPAKAPPPPLTVEGKLGKDDPADPVLKKVPHKVHEVALEAGKTYLIELRSKQFDTLVRVEDAAGKHLAHDDDSGGGTDSLLAFTPKEAGAYRVVVTAYPKGQAAGAYTLSVRPDDGRAAGDRRLIALNTEAARLLGAGDAAGAERRTAEALQVCAEVYPKKSHPDGHLLFAITLNNRGTALLLLGRLDEARDALGRALAMLEKIDPNNLAAGMSLHALGGVLHAQGKLGEAADHFRRALVVFDKTLPPEHPNRASVLSGLGVVLLAAGRPAEARVPLERALAIRRKALPEGHPELAHSLSNLAFVLTESGEPEKALPLAREALALMERARPAGHPDMAAGHSNLATILWQLGKNDEARDHLTRALDLSRKGLPADHPGLATVLGNYGLLCHATGRRAEGWSAMVGAARAWAGHKSAVAAGTAREDHPALLTLGTEARDALLTVAAAEPPGPAALRELLNVVLDAKGISAAALTRRQRQRLGSADPGTRDDFERLLGLRRRLADLLLGGGGGAPPERYRAACEEARRAADALELDLAQRVKALGAWREADRAGPAELADRLPPGSVLVETVRYAPRLFDAGPGRKEWGPPRYAALLLWRGGVAFVPLGAAKEIDGAVAEWRAAAQRGAPAGAADESLRRLLWGPLAGALPPKTARLVVAPEGALALVPLGAVRLEGGNYLIETMQISYVSSGRDLMPQPAPGAPAGGADLAVVLSDPDYDAGAEKAGAAGPPGAAPPRGGLQFKSLPGFGREARAVSALLARPGWKLEAAGRASASEERLRKAPRPRLLYLVTHGFFLEDVRRGQRGSGLRDLEVAGAGALPRFDGDPRLRSGLALAGANQWQERSAKGVSDGFLTALEVEDLDLWGTELVVLSACETGRGEVQVGEGVLGLRRAFQLAGARTVIASLWKVPDAETERLMSDTLSRWLKGAPPHDALRDAQLALIRHLRQAGARNGKQGEAPPLYWAGFICHGR